ncbi:hypothetical protein ASD54_15445 [Rhizobium sp. Root149]|jgi:hypothetical protein|uniref:hypothetical protein n=1 Tax=Rhizobium lemnae TaxID=1214924 RepID=UPI000712ACD7|nr:hypothetical protein [Rhizobium lemnae]KQZ49330.1 hypothetical protein ASD54_15445 [Rhizobium sp. Root149]MCJ8506637.1 hypothetical protein [Rhizobium lemnae]
MMMDMADVEITSLHWSSGLFHRDQTRDARAEKPQFSVPSEATPAFEVPAVDEKALDYSAIAPRLLREVALQHYVAGDIDQNTYIALAQELPMQISDTAGNVLDLSSVTDDTEFDFAAYYTDQRELAISLGDDEKAATLTSVLKFLNS